jgi:phospholipid/cholesterol/gamma-HCH transport system permease protein
VKLTELVKSFITTLGDFTLFVFQTVSSFRHAWRRKGLILKHCEFIGVNSLGVIVVAATFMGGVLGYQLYVSFKRFGAEALLGATTGVSLFRELAPVMAAIMVTGRAGAAIAAEMASMRISEQIDALEVMAVDPHEFLVAPRVMAGFAMVPLLSVVFGAVGSLASMVVACWIMGLDVPVFWAQFVKYVNPIELLHCTVKGAVFGMFLAWIGCFCGYTAYGGARAVGFATRTTVVASLLTILLSDYVLTSLLPFGFPNLKVETL